MASPVVRLPLILGKKYDRCDSKISFRDIMLRLCDCNRSIKGTFGTRAYPHPLSPVPEIDIFTIAKTILLLNYYSDFC